MFFGLPDPDQFVNGTNPELDPDFLSSVVDSVADPGCLSRILIFTHPGSRISDPKTATKERGEKNLIITFNVAINFTKLKIIFVLKS
jgi:hypothetical protein